MENQMGTPPIPKMNKLKYKIPVFGKIIKDRDTLQVERNNLLTQINNQPKSVIHVDFAKISKKYPTKITGIEKYLKGKKNIFDVGTGPKGSAWWQNIDQKTSITGVDLLFYPDIVPSNVKVYKYDASKLHQIKSTDSIERYTPPNLFKKEKIKWHNKFDMVVANHVLEHVDNPENLIKGISKLIKKEGIVYCGFPDYRNFTDVFYHLIHPDGGGHVQQLTNEIVQNLFEKNGFKLVECNIWPDSWGWLQTQYKPQNFGIKHINQSQLDYLCEVFRHELTPNKGYFYGWEMVFKKL